MTDELVRSPSSENEELGDFFENAPVALHWVGPDGDILRVNNAELNLLGYTREEVLGHQIAEFHADQDVIEDILGRLGRDEILRDYEARLRHKDGSIRQVLIDSSVYRRDGEFIHTRCITRDVTARKGIEQDLAISEERFRLASKAAHIGAWDWDLGNTIVWTGSLEEIYGFEAGTFPGTFEAFVGRIHPEDRDHAVGLIEHAVAHQSELDFDHRIIIPSGETRWIHGRGHFVLDGRGKATRMVGIGMDITARKRSEDELAASQAKARAVLETAANGIITMDQEGTIQDINAAALRTFGYREDEVLGRNVKMLMPSPYREEHDGYLERYLRTGEARIIGSGREVEGLRKNGSRFAMELGVSEVRIKDERLFTGIVNDISERRRAESGIELLASAGSLLHQSLDYETTLQAVGALLVPSFADWFSVHLLEEGELRRVNLMHRDPAMVQLAADLEEQYPLDPEATQGPHQVVRTGAAEWMSEIPEEMLEAAARDSEHRDILQRLGIVSYICAPISSQGSVLGALTLVTAESGKHYDEDDLRLAQELGRRIGRAIENAQLFRDSQIARAQLQRSIDAKDEFLGIVSHELRSPLTTILGSSRFLNQRRASLDEKTVSELLQDVEQGAARMNDLVENLLLLARAEVGQAADMTSTNVVALAANTINSIKRDRPERDISLTTDEMDITIDCVPTYVEEMLANLITNADKYSPAEEPIEVSVSREAEEIRIAVRDRGDGVTPAELPILFESFYRSPRTAARHPGKGLGLAVCRRLAEVQGGRVWAALRSGGGLEVGFALPKEAKVGE